MAADDFGSLSWGRRTGGRLSGAEMAREAARSVRAQVTALPSSLRWPLGSSPADSNGLRLAQPPDTELCDAALEAARSAENGPLLAHSLRCYLWADLLAQRDRVEFDPEILFCSCALHDLGLTDAHRPDPEEGCFAVAGGREAEELLTARGASLDFAGTVGDAISRHFNARVPLEAGAEAHLLHEAAYLDVLGNRLRHVSRDARRAVLQRHPIDGFSRRFRTALREEGRRRPRSRAALSRRLGASALIAANPLARDAR